MTLKVMTWFWRDPYCRTQYQPHHVNIWAHMVRRNLSIPHTIACVTDEPHGIEPWIEIIPTPKHFIDQWSPTWGLGKPQCYRRVSLFHPDAATIFGAERLVSMDMDCVIAGSLDPLFSRQEDVVFVVGEDRRTRARPYNGSMVLLTAGSRPHVFTSYGDAAIAAASDNFDGSDQAHYANCLGWGEATWTPPEVQWTSGVFTGRNKTKLPVGTKVVFFHGKHKPWDKPDLTWIKDYYHLDTSINA